MSRRLTGSVSRRGRRFEASVPARRGEPRRVSRNFAEEAPARAWVEVAIAAVEAGEPVPEPERTTDGPTVDPAPGPGWLEVLAREWHHEHYELGCRGGPRRSDDVRRGLRLHVLPYLADHTPTPGSFTRAAVLDLILMLAGRDQAPVSLDRAAGLCAMPLRRLQNRLTAAGARVDEHDGVGWVTLGELRRATGEELRIGLSNDVAAGILWSLRRIEEHAVGCGVLDAKVIGTLRVMKPHPAHALRSAPPRTALADRREPGSLGDIRIVAGHLHFLHQTVL
jgi:hypothetical protein